MALLKNICIYCWIAETFILFISAESCKENNEQTYDYRDKAKCIFGDVCYEFFEELKTWAEARDACLNQGGQLLNIINCEVKKFLEYLSTQVETGAGAWWVSEVLMGLYGKSFLNGSYTDYTTVQINEDSNDTVSSPFLCTYVTMNPFRMVTTPYCGMTLGYLCTLDFQKQTNDSSNKKERRSADQDQQITDELNKMTLAVTHINDLLSIAKDILYLLESEPLQISHAGKGTYFTYLYSSLKVGGFSNQTLDLIVNCTGGMLLYTLEQCGQEGIPAEQFEDLLVMAAIIYQEINLQRLHLTGDTTVVTLPTGTLYASKKLPKDLDKYVLGSKENGPYFQLPSFSAMQSQLPTGPVNIQMFDYNINPLSEDSNINVSGSVCSLSLESDVNEVKLHNLSQFIEMFLPRPGAEEPKAIQMTLTQGFAVIMSFNISEINATVIISSRPDRNVSLQLLLSQTYQTNISSALRRTILTGEEDYRWLITPEMMRSNNGTLYVNITPINYTSTVTLSVSVLTFKCMFWDTVEKEWSTVGCRVGKKSMPNMTHCLCDHTTFYGSSFFVMPNQVDLSKTVQLFATVTQNYVVLAVLCAVYFLYLVLVLWAWYADRRALRTRKMTLLEDNHPCALYNYMLNIQTGNRSGAGTTAKVMMTLEGTEGETNPHHLSDPDRPVFERGGVDMFLLSTPFSLGELQNIKLWHDNSGGHPDWYLNKVTVQDLQTRKVWHFLCSTWLNSKGEGTCKMTFNPAKKNEIASFGNIFQTRTSTGFRDEHIWMSIVDPPRHSPFTRVQRVSCCLSLLLCTMAINIMFWNIPTNQDSPAIIKIGFFSLTWQQIMVAVESALLMFPINILIVTIFRSIKPRIPPKEKTHADDGISSPPPAFAIQTFLKDTQDVVNLLSKSPKNQIKPLSGADLFTALNQVHEVIHIMQGENDSDPHWAHCSRFVFYSLCHLAFTLDQAGGRIFPNSEELQHVKSTVNLMLKKAEMVFTSHTVQRVARILLFSFVSHYNEFWVFLISPVPLPKKKKATGCKLPWWFVFVAWSLLLGISGISTFFTLLYGFKYGKESSIQWVITLTLSLFQSIFIIQPLKVVGLAIFFALILRPVSFEESEEVELLLQEQREKCELYCGRQMY